jgi:hypothetical protein
MVWGRYYRIIDTARSDKKRLAGIDIAVGHQIVSHRASGPRRVVRAVQVANMEQSGLRVRVVHLRRSAWKPYQYACAQGLLQGSPM